MRRVGLRELKNHLSKYVRQVRKGRGVLVTDRGEVVAELLPAGPAAAREVDDAGLVALARRGSLTLGARNRASLYPLLPIALPPGTAAGLLDAERGPR
jgi:prevent-host-death family protein